MTPLATLFAAHRAKLHEVIATSSSDRIRASILVQTARQARKLLASIAHDERTPVDGRFSTAGKWGQNGYGPKIDDLLAQARFHGRATDLRAGNLNLTGHAPDSRKEAA